MFDIMPMTVTWPEIAFRLLLTVLAGSLIGINREAGGHAAGFRTTVLVGLAACLAMIQANLLLPVGGKTEQSFAVMDTLRLPLGILTGVGFIGGGAIIKRGNMVSGITTAATLWIMTAIGLCMGGGQIGLGSAGTVVALVVLLPFKLIDQRLPRKQKAKLVLASDTDSAAAVQSAISSSRAVVRFVSKQRSTMGKMQSVFELKWADGKMDAEAIVGSIERHFDVDSFEVMGLEA